MMGTDSNIFLVDDDAFCISMYEEHLHNLGFTNLHSFYSGSDLLANLDKNPHVIFLDYYLDDFKALELLERIKIVNPKTYVIIVSGQSDMEIAIKMLTNGAFDYIIKDNSEAQKISEVMGKLIAANEYNKKLQPDNSATYNKKNLKVIMEAQEKVRKEISGELHDNVSQLLGASKLYIDLYIKSATKRNTLDELNLLDQSKNIIETAITEVRKISRSLNGTFIKNINLKEALLQMVSSLQLQDSFIVTTDIQLEQDKKLPSTQIQHEVYRIIQEQLNNTLRHSNAKHIYISVHIAENTLFVKVSDDGVGFDLNTIESGEGMHNILKRIKEVGGVYTLNTSPGKGCTWSISIPFVDNNISRLN